MSWNEITIAEIGNIITGKTPPTSVKENYGGTMPFITPSDMKGYRTIDDTERHISEKGKLSVWKCVLPPNSICVSCIGSDMGKVVITSKESISNQQINSIICNSKYDYQFVYYLMLMLRDPIRSLGKNATAVPILNKSKFSNIRIRVPPLPIQRRIASILSAYDDLIENNQKQIKLLEEAAQRLYKEWFVDLRFPGSESVRIVDGVPEGWRKVVLGDVAPILTGKKDANFGTADGPYPFFTCSQEPIKAPSYSFDTSAVILAGNGDFNVKLYRGKFEAYQRTYVLSPNNEEYLYLLYNAVLTNMAILANGASGSTIKFLTKGMIENIVFSIPTDGILERFNDLAESIQLKIECLKESIKETTEARDRLLPKLMSGELEAGE